MGEQELIRSVISVRMRAALAVWSAIDLSGGVFGLKGRCSAAGKDLAMVDFSFDEVSDLWPFCILLDKKLVFID